MGKSSPRCRRAGPTPPRREQPNQEQLHALSMRGHVVKMQERHHGICVACC